MTGKDFKFEDRRIDSGSVEPLLNPFENIDKLAEPRYENPTYPRPDDRLPFVHFADGTYGFVGTGDVDFPHADEPLLKDGGVLREFTNDSLFRKVEFPRLSDDIERFLSPADALKAVQDAEDEASALAVASQEIEAMKRETEARLAAARSQLERLNLRRLELGLKPVRDEGEISIGGAILKLSKSKTDPSATLDRLLQRMRTAQRTTDDDIARIYRRHFTIDTHADDLSDGLSKIIRSKDRSDPDTWYM